MQKPLLFLAGVLLGAGATGAAWLTFDSEPAPDGGRIAAVHAVTAAAPSSTTPAPAAPELPPPPTDDETDAALPRVDRLEIPDAPPASPPRGEGWIAGRVRDGAGHAVAGVHVALTSTEEVRSLPEPGAEETFAATADTHETLEDAVRWFAANWRRRRAATRTVETDTEGRFRIEDLPDGNYRLTARKKGWRIRGAKVVKPGTTVEMVAERLVPVSFDVFLPDGSPPTYAVLHILRPSQGGRVTDEHRYGWSPEKRTLSLDAGRFEAMADVPPEAAARAGVNGEWASERVPVVASAAAPPPVRLELHPRRGIRGHLTAGSRGFSDDTTTYYLLAVPLAPGQQPDDELARGFNGNPTMTHQWQGYRFAFLDIDPGRYALFVKNDWNGPALAKAVVEVRNSVEHVEIPLEDAVQGPAVFATVVGPDGEPVNEVSFTLSVRQPDRSNDTTPKVTRLDEPGRFRVELTDAALKALARPRSTVWLSCESAALGRVEHEVHSVDEEIALGFREPGTLLVRVVGFERPEVAGRLRVDIRPKGPLASYSYSPSEGRPGSDGIVRKSGLQPGRYIVSLQRRKGDQYWSEETIARTTVDVVPGVQRIEIAVPEFHSLVVLTPDLDDGDRLMLKAVGDERSKSGTVEEGKVTFDNLASGEYLVMRQDGMDVQVMRVTVPAAGPVTLATRPVNALRVTVGAQDGVYARAGFRDGDLVVAVDGEEFEGTAGLARIFLRGAARKESVFTVLRGGRRVEVRASLKDLQTAEDGSMEPWAR